MESLLRSFPNRPSIQYHTVTGVTLEEARQYAREMHAELWRHNGKGLPGPMPFSELIARYRDADLTDLSPNFQKTYGISLDAFQTFFVHESGDPAAHEIGRGHVNAFMTWRKRRSPDGTKRREPVSAPEGY